MKYTGAVNLNNPKKILLWGITAAVVLILLVVVVRLAGSSFGGQNLLAALPQPQEDAPLVVVEAQREEFPLQMLKLFAESSAISAGGTPLGDLLPIFAGADRSALIVTERETGIAFYGAIQIDRKEQKTLSAGKLPEGWMSAFVAPEITPKEPAGSFEIRAANLLTPLYVEVDGKRAYLADTFADVEAIRKVRSGETAGARRKWSLERRWKGHMLLSDGGVLATMAGDEENTDPVGLEIAWRSSGKDDKNGEAKWKVWGLEKRVGKNLARSLKTHNWSTETPLVPDHLLLSVGINMPNPGRNMANLPGWLKSFAGQLTKMGLKDSEAAGLLTGPMTLSLGGRTQILWFELPGVVLDVPGRGKLAYRVLDAFWSQLFMGAEPKPVDGFTHGGSTDLPFSVIAAANDKKMVIGLADPAMAQNKEIGKLIEEEKRAIGWFFVDLPMMGASLEEMSSVNTLLSSEDDARPVDGDSTRRLREAFGKLGKLFVVWDKPTGGHAKWYK